jgi:hypothetical protein
MTEVDQEQITSHFLKDVIESAGLDATIEMDEDEKITVKGLDFICYVSVNEELNLITMRTWLQCKEDVVIDQLREFVCNLNKKIIVQFNYTTYEDGRAYVDGYYQMPYKFGFNTKNFLYMLRKFTSVFIDSIREADTDDVFFK